MKIHKEGHKVLRNEIIILIALSVFYVILHEKIIETSIIIMIILFLTTLIFFRIPNRKFDIKEKNIHSPCDGKVVVIEETVESEFYKDKRIQISIFMSPLNIHNNLCPISGKITYKRYHPGRFLFAWKPKASTDNERSTLVFENKTISAL